MNLLRYYAKCTISRREIVKVREVLLTALLWMQLQQLSIQLQLRFKITIDTSLGKIEHQNFLGKCFLLTPGLQLLAKTV